MTPEQIAGLKALLEQATPGPWVLHDAEAFDGRSTTYYKEVWDENLNVIAEEVYRAHNDGGNANMHLIALAPTLARHVLTQQAQITALEAELAALKGKTPKWYDDPNAFVEDDEPQIGRDYA